MFEEQLCEEGTGSNASCEAAEILFYQCIFHGGWSEALFLTLIGLLLTLALTVWYTLGTFADRVFLLVTATLHHFSLASSLA